MQVDFVSLFVCYSCATPTFSFEWNKEVLDLASPEPKQTGTIYHSTSFHHLSTFP